MATNGGLIQLGASGSKAFTNLWKITGEHSRGNLDIEGFNANNFPTRTPPAGKEYASGCYTWSPNLKPGNLVLKWDGKASWNANGVNFGSTTVSGGRQVLTPPSYMNYPNTSDGYGQAGNTSILFKITGVGDVAPSNIRLCHADDEADLDAGQTFNDEWLNTVSRMKPATIRWLDNPSGSHCFAYDWTDHMAVEADNKWTGPKYVPTDFVDSVSFDSGTQTYICAKSGFTLSHGKRVHVRVPARPSTKIFYLNVEGTGAKPIRPYTGHQPDKGPSSEMIPRANAVATFFYHSAFDAWIISPGCCNASAGSAGQQLCDGWEIGIPLSVKVALCNTLGCDLWWNPPLLALDPFNTSYFTSAFTYFRDNLNPGLKVYVEGPNECWNYAVYGFASTFFLSWTEATRVGGTLLTSVQANGVSQTALEEAYGRLMSKMGEVLETVYSPADKGVKYELICGFQTATRYDFGGRTLCPNYVAENSTTNKPAINYITGFAIANYHNPSEYTKIGTGGTASPNWQGWPKLLYYLDKYWNNFADPNQGYTAQELQNRRNAQLRATRYMIDSCMTTTPYQAGPSYGGGYNDWMATRVEYLWNRYNKPVYFYEGGYSPDWHKVDPTITYQGLDPDGVLRPTTTGVQSGYGIKYAEFFRATKYDPKLRWVEFVKLKKLTNTGHGRLPARYFQSGDSGTWASYDPDPVTVRYLTGASYGGTSLAWRHPNLKGPCETTKGVEDFSNGRFVMYAKTA